MKKIILLASLITATIAAITQEPIKAKANDPYNLIGTGVSVIYNSDKDGGDYAWLSTYKRIGVIPGQVQQVDRVEINYVVVGFDAPNVESIVRMGFEVTYKEPNWWDNLRNRWLIMLGKEPKHGTPKSDTVLVKADTTYTFIDEKNLYQLADITKYNYPAIGRVADLLQIESTYKNDVNASAAALGVSYLGDAKTGGYYFNFNYKDSLNNNAKSFTKREFYAVIPYYWTDEIQPESIKCYLLDGTLVDDGLDEDGNAYVDPITEDYYIDLTVGRDVGVAINGTNARVTRIEISGYDNLNDTGILIQNSNFDYATQSTTNVVQQKLFVGNTTYNANWTITNENRYIFIKFDGELDDASKLKVRVFYRNDNAKQSWIIRVTDADGNFLPPPYETVPTMRQPDGDDRWERILTLLGVGILGLVALYGISKLFEILANVKRAVS